MFPDSLVFVSSADGLLDVCSSAVFLTCEFSRGVGFGFPEFCIGGKGSEELP